MQHTGSADGTSIAFDVVGRTGAAVVIIGGALSTADAARPVAAALAGAGLRGVVMDRRGRGGSGDTAAVDPQQEVDDVTAVLTAVGGGALLGHSSGAVLALLTAASGGRPAHLFLSEPPFLFGVDEPPADLPERLAALVAGDLPAAAVETFLREGVGLPEAVVAGMRDADGFTPLLPLARSTVRDAALVRAVSTPTPAMLEVRAPVTILRGNPTFPVLAAAALRLSAAMPAAELVVVPESHDHGMDPAGSAREVAARFPAR